MTTQTAARVFHRDQLDAWGVPNDLATDPATAPEGAAIELHSEQIETRRWVSVHELVFRAPDDGKAYRVTYERGLTEVQEDHDKWDYRDHVVGEEVEEYERPVKAWRRVGEQPAKPSAVVTLRPTADPNEITLTAESHGMNPARVAYGLRKAADAFDRRARAEGDEPIPYTPSPEAARELARALARRITELGKARGWSTWAADYIHPDREFVDTGAPAEDDEAQQ